MKSVLAAVALGLACLSCAAAAQQPPAETEPFIKADPLAPEMVEACDYAEAMLEERIGTGFAVRSRAGRYRAHVEVDYVFRFVLAGGDAWDVAVHRDLHRQLYVTAMTKAP